MEEAWGAVLSFIMVIQAGLEVVQAVFGAVEAAPRVIKAGFWLVGKRLQRMVEWVEAIAGQTVSSLSSLAFSMGY